MSDYIYGVEKIKLTHEEIKEIYDNDDISEKDLEVISDAIYQLSNIFLIHYKNEN